MSVKIFKGNFLYFFAVILMLILFIPTHHLVKASELSECKTVESAKIVVEGEEMENNIEKECDANIIKEEELKETENKKGKDKILVTGACGYIGSHVCVELLDSGYDIVGIDSFCNCSRDVKENIQKITGKKFNVYDCDICDLNKLDQIFKNEKIDAVMHFAGLKSIKESYLNPIEYYENNVVGSLNILTLMKKYNVKNLVFSSSATVYGRDAIPPFNEAMRTEFPANPYGKTKFIIEQMILDMHDINSVILRYFNPVGAHPSHLIGENPNGTPNNLIPIIVSVCLGKLPKLTVFGNDYDTPDGTCIRDYIHIVDLAKGHLKAVSYLNDHKGHHIFNLGTGKGTSVLELIHTFEKVNNIKVNYEIGARREGDLPVCFASCEKAHKELGWESKLTIEDMCKSAWDWAKNMKNRKNS